jgi:hypothetical protein
MSSNRFRRPPIHRKTFEISEITILHTKNIGRGSNFSANDCASLWLVRLGPWLVLEGFLEFVLRVVVWITGSLLTD